MHYKDFLMPCKTCLDREKKVLCIELENKSRYFDVLFHFRSFSSFFFMEVLFVIARLTPIPTNPPTHHPPLINQPQEILFGCQKKANLNHTNMTVVWNLTFVFL
jgi:hypothetical protein